MSISPKFISYSLASMLIGYSVSGLALEPGALTPSRPDYQLPPLPQVLPKTPPSTLQPPTETPSLARADDTLKFILKEVIFDQALPETIQELQPIVAPLLGKSVSRLDLDTLRLELLQKCKTLGFLYPSVILPSQQIKQGIVHYQVYEGHLTQINIEGAERLHEDYLRKRLQPDDGPLERTELQERFQLLLTDPLIERVNGALRPGANPGDAILDLSVKRAKPYELHLGMDNYTPPTVGSYTGHLDGTVRNLTGWGDFLRLNLNGSGGTKGISSYFSMPLNAYDTRLNLGFQGSEANVIESHLKSLDIQNNFMDVNIGVSHPLYHTINRIFSVESQFAYRQTHTLLQNSAFPAAFGNEDNGKATVSVVRLIQNYLDRDVDRVLSFRSSFNIGIDAFDATTHSDNKPDSHYFSWLGQLRYVHNLDQRGTQFFFRGDVQLASRNLLPLERFALGGVYTIRGYRQNEMVRDEGYALGFELRYPLILPNEANGHKLNLVPFYDLGGAWNLDANGSKVDDVYQTLMGIGMGLQWSWEQFDADFYWARALSHHPPLSNIDNDIQDQGIYFRLHARLL